MFEFEVLGDPASKANGRRAVFIGGRQKFIKSEKALQYEKLFKVQCPILTPLISYDVGVAIDIFYATRRSDLDESIILDCMQGMIYENDRQVRAKNIRGGIDRDNPRAIIRILSLDDPCYHHTSAEGLGWDE